MSTRRATRLALLLLGALSAKLLPACANRATATADASPTAAAVEASSPDSSSPSIDSGASTEAPPDAAATASAQLRTITLAWNAATNSHDAGALEGLYADPLDFYGSRVSRAEALKRKRAAFAAHVRDDLSDIVITDSHATFEKASTLKGGRVVKVTGYLDFDDGGIISEEDLPALNAVHREEQRRASARAQEELQQQMPCDSAMFALVDATAPARRAFDGIVSAAKKDHLNVSPGAMSFPPEEQGAPWQVGICENWPDREPCYWWFDIDPATARTTYEEKPVATDPDLAAKVREVCGAWLLKRWPPSSRTR